MRYLSLHHSLEWYRAVGQSIHSQACLPKILRLCMQPSISEIVQVALQCLTRSLSFTSALFTISWRLLLLTNVSKHFRNRVWALQWHEPKNQTSYANGEKQNFSFGCKKITQTTGFWGPCNQHHINIHWCIFSDVYNCIFSYSCWALSISKKLKSRRISQETKPAIGYLSCSLNQWWERSLHATVHSLPAVTKCGLPLSVKFITHICFFL